MTTLHIDELDRFRNAVRSISRTLCEANIAGIELLDKNSYNGEAVSVTARLFEANKSYADADTAKRVLQEMYTLYFFKEFVELIDFSSLARSVSARYTDAMKE